MTSSGTAMVEIVGEDSSVAVLVDPLDPVGLAATIDELTADPDRLATMGRAALERARTFSWARTAAGLRDAYAEAIGR